MILCPDNMRAIRINLPNLIFCKLSGALWRQGGERKESLQLRLWNLNSISNSPVAPRRLSRQISANKREPETSANVNKHWKTSAKGNDVITNVISENQHFAPTFRCGHSNSRDVVASSSSFTAQPPERSEKLAYRLYFL